jgi:hypothetical protein
VTWPAASVENCASTFGPPNPGPTSLGQMGTTLN